MVILTYLSQEIDSKADFCLRMYAPIVQSYARFWARESNNNGLCDKIVDLGNNFTNEIFEPFSINKTQNPKNPKTPKPFGDHNLKPFGVPQPQLKSATPVKIRNPSQNPQPHNILPSKSKTPIKILNPSFTCLSSPLLKHLVVKNMYTGTATWIILAASTMGSVDNFDEIFDRNKYWSHSSNKFSKV